MDGEAGQRRAGDPAQAFEDLRAEVSVLRRAVEALPHAWNESRPPDYSPDLGRIAKALATVETRIQAINAHPVLRLTPEQHQQAVVQAGSVLLREAAQKLERASQEVDRERGRLAGLVGTMRGRKQQRNWLLWAGGGALLAGLILSPILSGWLPFGLDGRVAASIMGGSRWDAGAALMQAESPQGWRSITDATELVKANHEALRACNRAAAEAKKGQDCMIIVAPPLNHVRAEIARADCQMCEYPVEEGAPIGNQKGKVSNENFSESLYY